MSMQITHCVFNADKYGVGRSRQEYRMILFGDVLYVFVLERICNTQNGNEKAFQWNANRPLADSTDYIVDKFSLQEGARLGDSNVTFD